MCFVGHVCGVGDVYRGRVVCAVVPEEIFPRFGGADPEAFNLDKPSVIYKYRGAKCFQNNCFFFFRWTPRKFGVSSRLQFKNKTGVPKIFRVSFFLGTPPFLLLLLVSLSRPYKRGTLKKRHAHFREHWTSP